MILTLFIQTFPDIKQVTGYSVLGSQDGCTFFLRHSSLTSVGIKLITSFPRQLQSERFLPHSIPTTNPPNLLREKLILFLALHSLCATKLSQTPVCFPSSVEWGWGITVELTLDG